MKELIRFPIGSKYFFKNMEGYTSKDNDILIIMDNWVLSKTNTLNLKDEKNNDIFFFKNLNKEEFINDTIKSRVTMRGGKFLIKEFNEYIGFTINDLKKLNNVFQKMDEKHLYEKYIYECYIINNKFELTDKQLNEAYRIYKKYRC